MGGMNQINYYPFSENRTIYVNNTTANATLANGTTERAIYAARDPGALPLVGCVVKRSKNKANRKRLLAISPYCNWCGIRLMIGTATIDHVIPIARGGTNNKGNLVLACQPCNQRRGHC